MLEAEPGDRLLMLRAEPKDLSCVRRNLTTCVASE